MEAQLFTDGAARGNPGPSGCACLLFDQQGKLLDYNGKFLGSGTNNQAEYRGLLLGVKLALKYGVNMLTCYLDSELVVKQLRGEYKIKDANIAKVKAEIDKNLAGFGKITFVHVPREENRLADKLVNLILDARGN